MRRVLLYSHDTFGLGHLRRSRTIAQALTSARSDVSALIVTGSPVVGRFNFGDRIDHVRLPGVVKLSDGSYAAHNLGLGLDEIVHLRSSILHAAADAFKPDMVIVDKEPTGFRGELLTTLEAMTTSQHRPRVVLGVRDVLDSPDVVASEWDRKGASTVLDRFYDEIWVYGLKEIYEPLAGVDIGPHWKQRTHYTGYLRRVPTSEQPFDPALQRFDDYILVTPGGGGDGAHLIDWVISAYEADPNLTTPAIIVYGPFLDHQAKADFDGRAAKHPERLQTLGFNSNMEQLLERASGVVAMGGYNTFCEILSLDKPALIEPRTVPRLEQYIRTEAAERLGLVRMIDRTRDGSEPQVMAEAMKALSTMKPPSTIYQSGLLSGLDRIVDRTNFWFDSDLPIAAHG